MTFLQGRSQEYHYTEFEVDLTELVQRANCDDIQILLSALSQFRSSITTTIIDQLFKLVQCGFFSQGERPTRCVVKGIFTYYNPYFDKEQKEWIPQTPEDVRIYFQTVINAALARVEFPFRLDITVPDCTVYASTFGETGEA